MENKIDLMIEDIRYNLDTVKDNERRVWQEKYMRNQFTFLGVDKGKLKAYMVEFEKKWLKVKPDVKDVVDFYSKGHTKYDLNDTTNLTKLYVAEQVMLLAKKLFFDAKSREEQYFAMDLLKKYVKKVPITAIDLYEELILKDSWWDTVDTLATTHVYEYFKLYPQERDKYIAKWRKGKQMWLVRTAIIFQNKMRDKTDIKLLFDLCDENKDSKEFFMQKAMGWALRELRKTSRNIVDDFLEKNGANLPKLTVRVALERGDKDL